MSSDLFSIRIMKRLNRQKLLTTFEEARNGFNQAHMRAAEHGDEVLMACMEAHHFNMNNMIVELGGERVQLPDLKQFLENSLDRLPKKANVTTKE